MEKKNNKFGFVHRNRTALTAMLFLVSLVIIAGVTFILGYIGGVAGDSGSDSSATLKTASNVEEETYTCPMHPEIITHEPGNCPICGMDLVLKTGVITGENKREVQMHDEVANILAEIRTSPVERKFVDAEVRLTGKIAFDETRTKEITSRFPGRLEKLFVDYTGVPVKTGEHLFEIYSPELVTAQQELLQAKKAADSLAADDMESIKKMASITLNAAREKIRLWGLSAEQVEQIEKQDAPIERMTVNAPIGGIVINKHAVEGSYVKTGTPVYTIADLSRLWVKLDAYESDLRWLYYAQNVDFFVEAYPGKPFKGTVSFIDPVLNPKTRTTKLRVNVENPEGLLKPEMFVHAIVKVRVGDEGDILKKSLAGKYICPMHPEVMSDKPGDCNVCGMKLELAETLIMAPVKSDIEPGLVIPASAPMITGTRAVVYVRVPGSEPAKFEGRDVLLAGRAGDYYLVKEGLKEGELVVTNGNFKIDSDLQIKQVTSMMNPSSAVSSSVQPIPDKPDNVYAVPDEFRTGLDTALKEYRAMADAIFENNSNMASNKARELSKALEKINMNLLSGNAHIAWMGMLEQAKKGLNTIVSTQDIAIQREGLASVSSIMISAVETFGYKGAGVLYRFECTMALGGKGAVWLQDSVDTHNPYFGKGAGMAKCKTGMNEIPAIPEKPVAKPKSGGQHEH